MAQGTIEMGFRRPRGVAVSFWERRAAERSAIQYRVHPSCYLRTPKNLDRRPGNLDHSMDYELYRGMWP